MDDFNDSSLCRSRGIKFPKKGGGGGRGKKGEKKERGNEGRRKGRRREGREIQIVPAYYLAIKQLSN